MFNVVKLVNTFNLDVLLSSKLVFDNPRLCNVVIFSIPSILFNFGLSDISKTTNSQYPVSYNSFKKSILVKPVLDKFNVSKFLKFTIDLLLLLILELLAKFNILKLSHA